MKSYANDQFSIIFPTLRKAELTDTEFYGVLALALCDLGEIFVLIYNKKMITERWLEKEGCSSDANFYGFLRKFYKM